MRDAGRQHPRIGGKRPLIVAEVQVDGLLVGIVHLLVGTLLLHEKHRATQLQKLVVLVQTQFVKPLRNQFHSQPFSRSRYPSMASIEFTSVASAHGPLIRLFQLMGLLYPTPSPRRPFPFR